MSKAVHIEDQEYTYKVFGSGVEIRMPEDNSRHFVTMSKITGWTQDELDRAKIKGTGLPAITPSLVKDYILERILNTEGGDNG